MWKQIKNLLSLRFEGGTRKATKGLGRVYSVNMGPNVEIGYTSDDLVGNCRFLAENNPLATSALTAYCDYSIGGKIAFDYKQVKGSKRLKKAAKDKIDRVFQSKQFDYMEENNFIDFVWNAHYNALASGGVFIILRDNAEVRKNTELGVQFEMVELDHLARDYRFNKVLDDNRYIDKGIEFDSKGRIIAYHLYPNHPHDQVLPVSLAKREPIRIPKSHCFFYKYTPKNRPKQVLGMPLLTQVIIELEELITYKRSQVKKQSLSGMFAMILKKLSGAALFGTPSSDGGSVNQGSSGGAPVNEHKNVIKSLNNGTILEVPEGQEAVFPAQPKTEEYGEFIKVGAEMVSAGTHVPVPLLTHNFENVNFSSLRGAMLPFFRRVTHMRAGMQHGLMEFIFTAVLNSISIRSSSDVNDVLKGLPRVRYQAKYMFDPVKEAQALEKMLQIGAYSLQDVVDEYGYGDYESTMEERKEHKELKEKYGLFESGDYGDTLGRHGVDSRESSPDSDSEEQGANRNAE